MKITFNLIDKDDGGYFFFAPCIYTFNKTRLSFGLEILGRRYFYTNISFY